MSSWTNVANSVAVQYAGRAVGLLISLASTALLARTLGVAGYGEFTTALALAGLVVMLSDLGFFWSTLKSLGGAEPPRTVASEIIGIRLALTLGLTVLGLTIVWLSSYALPIKQAVTILGIFILSSGLNNVIIAVHQGDYAMGWPTISEIVGRLTNLILIALGVWLKLDLLWFVVAVSVASTVNLAINWAILSRRHGSIRPKFFGFSWSKYYSSVLFLGVVTLLGALYLRVDVIVLSLLKSATDVGIYGAAGKVIEIAMVFQALFLAAVFPMLLARLKEGREQFQQALAESFLIVFVIGLPITLILIGLAQELIHFIAGGEFVVAAQVTAWGEAITTPRVLALMAGYVILAHLGGVFSLGLIAANHLKWLLAVNGLALAVNLVLNLIFIPQYSYLAAAIITLATELLVTIFNIFKLSYHFRPRINWGAVGAATVAGLAAISLLLIPIPLHVAIKVVVIALFYLVLLIAMVPAAKRAFAHYSASLRRPNDL